MVYWRYVEVWTVLACPSHGHRVIMALPCVLGGLGMSSGLGTPQVGARKKITKKDSHEEIDRCSNMN